MVVCLFALFCLVWSVVWLYSGLSDCLCFVTSGLVLLALVRLDFLVGRLNACLVWLVWLPWIVLFV